MQIVKIEKLTLRLAEQTGRLVCHPITLAAFVMSVPILGLFTDLEHVGFYLHCLVAVILFTTASAERSDSLAIHAKLDEIIKSHPTARNELMQSEHLPAKQIVDLAPDK